MASLQHPQCPNQQLLGSFHVSSVQLRQHLRGGKRVHVPGLPSIFLAPTSGECPGLVQNVNKMCSEAFLTL